MKSRRIHVSVVLFPECDPSIVYGVFDTLWAVGRLWDPGNNDVAAADEPLFEPRVVAAEPGPLKLVTGVSVLPQDAIADIQRTDIVFVPNVVVNSERCIANLDRRLIDWIARMHRNGAHVYSACGGSLVLAEAGLLEGEEATTHTSYAPLFRKRFPNVVLHETRILVQGGSGHSLVCGGGASSWQDLALLLIAKRAGTQEAIRISKLFLYQWHRDGQLPYASMSANVNHGDAAILRCQTWIAQNYEKPDVVARMAAQSGMPKRTFDRRFRAATGYSPLGYVQALRIEEAKQMLETGAEAIEDVAREVGYEDLTSFRRLFVRLTGITPGDYRRNFQLPDFVVDAMPKARPARKAKTPDRRRAAALAS